MFPSPPPRGHEPIERTRQAEEMHLSKHIEDASTVAAQRPSMDTGRTATDICEDVIDEFFDNAVLELASTIYDRESQNAEQKGGFVRVDGRERDDLTKSHAGFDLANHVREHGHQPYQVTKAAEMSLRQPGRSQQEDPVLFKLPPITQ